MADNNQPKSQLFGAVTSGLIVLSVLGALVGPKLVGLRKPKPFDAVYASHQYPSVKIGINPKLIDQALGGTNAVTRAQMKALLQTQEVSATAAIEAANQRAQYAEGQADKWQEEVAVYHDREDREANDKKIQTIMMVILTIATVVLVIFAIKSKSMPEWAKDVAKTAAGAVIAAWIR